MENVRIRRLMVSLLLKRRSRRLRRRYQSLSPVRVYLPLRPHQLYQHDKSRRESASHLLSRLSPSLYVLRCWETPLFRSSPDFTTAG